MEKRTIKFRVWDKDLKRFLDIQSLKFSEGSPVSILWGATPDEGPFEKRITNSIINPIILMQFTGRLDKNGKEMYEGDIVKVTNEGFDWEHIGPIEFNEGRFFVHTKGYVPGLYNIAHVYEVIGNIFSNPEMLNP